MYTSISWFDPIPNPRLLHAEPMPLQIPFTESKLLQFHRHKAQLLSIDQSPMIPPDQGMSWEEKWEYEIEIQRKSFPIRQGMKISVVIN
jgi:hypothetical protein